MLKPGASDEPTEGQTSRPRVRRADRGGRVREGPPGAASAFLFGIARHGAVGNAYDPLSLGNLFLP